ITRPPRCTLFPYTTLFRSTTDDPLDSLEHHRKIADDNFEVKVLPAFRPDKAMNADSAVTFNEYVAKLEKIVDRNIVTYNQYLDRSEEHTSELQSRENLVCR